MARLINYGTGDILDRLTILALKELHYGAARKPIDHLVQERNALLPKLYTTELPKAAMEHLLELAAINATLWAKTDELRETAERMRQDTADAAVAQHKAGGLGVQILRLNDRRAQLVDQINQLTGEHRGNEKG